MFTHGAETACVPLRLEVVVSVVVVVVVSVVVMVSVVVVLVVVASFSYLLTYLLVSFSLYYLHFFHLHTFFFLINCLLRISTFFPFIHSTYSFFSLFFFALFFTLSLSFTLFISLSSLHFATLSSFSPSLLLPSSLVTPPTPYHSYHQTDHIFKPILHPLR